ncbi:MAG TPA: ArgE/DapE family deacylase [Gemmatimonadaceae bacterium]|nr:ArgE/DapE family deacylase [Gemmatimonadaceae bacterium]
MIERGDAVALARELVRVDSRNPSLARGAPGEREVARVLAGVLRAWGLQVEVSEAAAGRPNVIARTGDPASGGRSLMFNGHLDVVGVEGMVHAPFEALEREGKMYGRGATDMKGGVAAMCAAAARAAQAGIGGELVVAAVADEEHASIGTQALVGSGVRVDAAIVTEPTRLAIAPAHRGFAWITVRVNGRAAHGSRYDIGVDAIRHAGLLLAELDALDAGALLERTHPLLGHASLHASLIEGGTAMSVYPDHCTLRLERRTMPGESEDQVVEEIRAACKRVARRRPDFSADVELELSRSPSDVAVDAPIVRALASVIEESGERVRTEGMSAWTDAAILNDAGIPAICFGPGDIALAHAAEEWVDTAEIERAANTLTELALRWCAGRSDEQCS